MSVFSKVEAHRTAQVRQALRDEGKPVRRRALDRMTAATALKHHLTLVTNNLRDYADSAHLKLQPAQLP